MMITREFERKYNEMKLSYKNLVNANVDLVDENKNLKQEIERLNDVVNKLDDEKEKLLKYKRFIFNIIITPLNWDRPYHYQLHNYTKQNLYEQLYNLRKEIIDELRGDNNG